MVSGKNFREIFKRNLVEFLCGFLGWFPPIKPGHIFEMKFGIAKEILILCNKTIIFQYIQNPIVRKNKVFRIHIVLFMSCKPFDVRFGKKIVICRKKELVPADFSILLELSQFFLAFLLLSSSSDDFLQRWHLKMLLKT